MYNHQINRNITWLHLAITFECLLLLLGYTVFNGVFVGLPLLILVSTIIFTAGLICHCYIIRQGMWRNGYLRIVRVTTFLLASIGYTLTIYLILNHFIGGRL